MMKFGFSVMLSFGIAANALRIAPVVNTKTKMDIEDNIEKEGSMNEDGLEMNHPLSQKDFSFNAQKSGLRPKILKKIESLKPDFSNTKPIIYFVGDSIIRQQATVACAVVTETENVKKVPFNSWDYAKMDYHCEGPVGKVVFAWSPTLQTPSKVAELKEQFGAPNVIIWDAAYWIQNRTGESWLQEYEHSAAETMKAFAKDAPNATRKVFLSHEPCIHKVGWLKRSKTPTSEQVKAMNDIQVILSKSLVHIGSPTKIADGNEFTKKLGCSETNDGIHYDTNVFEELMMTLEA
jgi:hypothetical protein